MQINKIRKLDGTKIKILALILMVADHIHQMFVGFGAPTWLTYLGRPVFPLFLFVAAEGFYYTKSRKKYLLRLLYASWFMTISSIALQIILPNKSLVLLNNAFSTFFIYPAHFIITTDYDNSSVHHQLLPRGYTCPCNTLYVNTQYSFS